MPNTFWYTLDGSPWVLYFFPDVMSATSAGTDEAFIVNGARHFFVNARAFVLVRLRMYEQRHLVAKRENGDLVAKRANVHLAVFLMAAGPAPLRRPSGVRRGC